ncbi:unnamed protein product [Cuscuta campestris]|uniref:ELM2 domain-containing protein n=1 Tax=Cuscuta campestris TaxID=132261 RepID=A0A484L663_9ASTE|nr:unnamed protein product [Cuscuta campestris]
MAGLKRRVEQGIVKGCSAVEPGRSIFGKYSDVDMLFQLKRIALNPCDPEVSFKKCGSLLNQTLRVREALTISQTNSSRRKRKFQLFVKEKLRNTPNLPLEVFEKETEGKNKRKQLSHMSTASCFHDSVKSKSFDKNAILTSHSAKSLVSFEDTLQERVFPETLLNAVDMGPPAHYISPVVDSDESVNGVDHLSSVDQTLNPIEAPLQDTNKLIHNSKSLAMKGTRSRHLQPPLRSIRLMGLTGDDSQKMVVPVGPRFQAEVPEWTEPHGHGKADSADGVPDDSRWLGTKVWPIVTDNASEATSAVGKGRAEACTCQVPGSVDCVRCHVIEQRFLLQCDLGPAFSAWKFDQMGEEMVKSWTVKEQKTYEPLVNMELHSNGKKFLKHALKSNRSEYRKTAIQYYFNVFLPRRISMQTRSSSVELVDTDDDADDSSCLHLPSNRCNSKSVNPKRSYGAKKTRYLRVLT